MGAAVVDEGQYVAGWVAEAHSPEDGAGVEDGVALGARIDGGLVMGWLVAAVDGGTLGEDLETGDRCGIAMELPADEAGDGITLFHAGTLEQPMARVAAGPVTGTVERGDGLGADEGGFVGGPGGQVFHVFLLTGTDAAKTAEALELAGHRVVHQEADTVAGEKTEIHATAHRLHAGIVLAAGPVLIVAH